MLGRNTDWLQGSVLSDDDAHSLGLVGSPGSDTRLVVISHDCDLPNDAEAVVELIAGMVVAKADPMLAKARNPRRLHLAMSTSTGLPIYIELQHANRFCVEKTVFVKAQHPDGALLLSADEKRVLKQWLAARYGRPAFPNSFENRLRKQIKKKTVEQLIARLLEPESSYLVGLFFDLGEERLSELPDGEPYFLSISVVYDATEGGQAARKSAETVAKGLTELFHTVYGAPECAEDLALEKCAAVSDTYLTLADLRKVDQWRLEYISLRDDPPSEFLAVGELPA